MICEICKNEYKFISKLHKVKCDKIVHLKDEIIKLYIEDFYTVKDLRKKFNLQSEDIKHILGVNLRSPSISIKLARKLKPDKFIISSETKEKMRIARINFMKANPEKTAWRTSTISFPERIFLNKIFEHNLDKKHLIVREYCIFPYYIDFAFINEKIAIEIDGSQHMLFERQAHDQKRDSFLNSKGWTTIRISANDVLFNSDYIINELIQNILSNNQNHNLSNIGYFGTSPYKKKYIKKERPDGKNTEKEIESRLKKRKVQNRPSIENLLEQVNLVGYKKTGIKYNVSDNTIKKWLGNSAPKFRNKNKLQ